MRNLWRKFTQYFIPSEDNVYRPHLLSKPWLIFFLTIVLTTEGAFVTSFLADYPITGLPAAIVPAEVVAFTNAERVQNNTTLLNENALLAGAALSKAQDMAAKGYFSHNGPDGKEPWRWVEEAGYAYQYAGENLAVRFDDSANVVNAWMASPTHRANIVKPVYTEIGVGVAEGMYKGAPAKFVVQYFATPLAAAPVVVSQEVSQAETPTSAEQDILPQVGGASTVQAPAAPTSSTMTGNTPALTEAAPHDPFTQQVARVVAESETTIPWILGGVATLLLVLLALAFFIHIEVQSNEMVLGGGLIAVTAILFLVLNLKMPESGMDNAQSASVANIRAGVLVGEDATAIESPPSHSRIPLEQ